ncbi:hypothetical protein CPT_Machias_260 [Staphylococcus phage Machias]|nr:hypothetical protein CPT_Machias_260 [Staphylococcus phage Machias]
MAWIIGALVFVIIILIILVLLQANEIGNINEKTKYLYNEDRIYQDKNIFGTNINGIMEFLNMSFLLISEKDGGERLYAGHYLLKNPDKKFFVKGELGVTSEELLSDKDKREYLFSRSVKRPMFYDHWFNFIENNEKLNMKKTKKISKEYNDIINGILNVEQIKEFNDYMNGNLYKNK